MPSSGNPFPKLTKIVKTSERTDCYNCIGWAFEDNTRFWWPVDNPLSYWPLDYSDKSIREAFIELFSALGWEETTNREVENDYKKIALYTDKDGTPTHASRLLNTGYWTSKLGRDMDISHSYECLDGPAYGAVEKIYKKPI